MGEISRKGLISVDDSVLLVIDIQEKLLPVMHDPERVLENNIKLARFAKIVGLPVLVTEQEKLGPTVPPLGGEIEHLDPVMKLHFNACRVPEFNERLAEIDRRNVVLTGIESHVCVTQTALDLVRGHNVHVVSDAVSSRARENYEVALHRMEHAGAIITSTEMVIYELLERAGTDEFREVLKLVK